MVLVSFLLVLAAAVTLVVGLLQSGLGLIYVSIGCSVVAGVVLAVAVLRGRPDDGAVPAGPRAAPAAAGTPPPQSWQPTSPQPEPVAAGASTAAWGRPDGTPPPSGDDDVSPEAAGLAERLRQRREAGGDDVEADSGSGTEEVELAGPGSDFDGDDDEYDDDEDEMGEMPIDDYDRLRASEILSRLPGLSRPQLLAVRAHEMSTMNRFTVMSRIEGELARQGDSEEAWEVEDADWDGDEEPVAPGRATRSTRKATTGRSRSTASRAARKAPARKASATKATAKKAAVKKAASATRTPAAKATARKATATKAPAKKATAKKAASSRTSAAKRATKRS